MWFFKTIFGIEIEYVGVLHLLNGVTHQFCEKLLVGQSIYNFSSVVSSNLLIFSSFYLKLVQKYSLKLLIHPVI
jgi:hypothetical protein